MVRLMLRCSNTSELSPCLRSPLIKLRVACQSKLTKKERKRNFKLMTWFISSYKNIGRIRWRREHATKLSKRYFGPFKIVERIGKVAYKLQLPEGSKVHPVFHVSLLKQCHRDNHIDIDELTELEVSSQTIYTPEAVLNSRDSEKGRQLLIKWKGKPSEEATWEFDSEFISVFPEFQNIGDNVVFQGKGVDMIHNTNPTLDPTQPMSVRPKRDIKTPARLLD